MPLPKFGDVLIPKAAPTPAQGEVSVTAPDANGVVTWKIINTGGTTGSWVLQRGAAQNGIPFETYVFGGAFPVAYLNNAATFGTYLLEGHPPTLYGSGVAPMGIISSPGGMFFAFVFTVAAGQAFSMEEGGFSGGVTPVNPVLVPVTYDATETFSVAWQSEQCSGFNQQTGSDLPCPSNPWTVSGTVFSTTEPVPIITADTFTPVGGGSAPNPPPTCVQLLDEAAVELEAGNVLSSVEDVIAFLMCEIDSGAVSMSHVLKAVVEEAHKRR